MASFSTPQPPFPISVIKLLRPKQWSKNLLVFAAVLFVGKAAGIDAWRLAVETFIAMSLVSSSTYVFNDIFDAKQDRMHPEKKLRPIASGAISPPTAATIACILLALGTGLALAINAKVLICVGIYIAMQVAYNVYLKHVAVADVFTIAVGFVLRAVMGAAAIGVGISGWLLFCTGSLALMLGFAKRRHEFILQGDDRESSRKSLVGYSRAALDGFVLMFAAASAISYGIYCLESTTGRKFPGLILTASFVLYGIARYILIVFSNDEGGEPADVLFSDFHMIASVVLFILAAVLAMSGFRLPIIEQ